MSVEYPGFYNGKFFPKHFPDWMKGQADIIPISLLAVPGTHDSCARSEAQGVKWKCQTVSIGEQLLGGIRYFDIRLVLENGTFQVHHRSVAQNITFSEVQKTTFDFLRKYPSEFVYMRVKHEEGTLDGFESTFLSKVYPYSSSWFLENRIPRLGEVRGKIVLLQNFESLNLGIPWDGASMKLQDVWELPDTKEGIVMKEQAIYNFSVMVHDMNDPNFLYLSHLSGSAGPLPSTVAENTNCFFLSEHLENYRPVGVVIADYPSSLLIESIISSNVVASAIANTSIDRGIIIAGIVCVVAIFISLYLVGRLWRRGVSPASYDALVI